MPLFLSSLAASLFFACQAKHRPAMGAASGGAAVKAVMSSTTAKTFPGLQFYTWQLVEMVSPEGGASIKLPFGVSEERFHMRFDQYRLSLWGDCNKMRAYVYMESDNTYRLESFRMTQIRCGSPLDQADDLMHENISQTTRYRLSQEGGQYQLDLSTKSGMRFRFIGSPTLELTHGPSKQRFIEIEMDNQPCPEKPCLKWRELTYEKDHTKRPVGQGWETVFPGVDGFVPKPNYNYVLRLKEYQTPKGKLWVHDLTVSMTIQEPVNVSKP